MAKWFKHLIVVVFGLFIIGAGTLGYLYFFHGYHGSDVVIKGPDVDHDGLANLIDQDADGDGVPNQKDIAANAESLVGTLYDPLKGGYRNIGGKMGFIVCIDVPRIAYANAGIYFQSLLTDDFKKNPEHYDTQNGMNTPDTPYFFRRVRNVYDYARGNGLLIEKSQTPQVGDIVFYGRYHATLVSKVYKDGTYDEIEAHPKLIFVEKHTHKKWQPRDIARILPK